jgi:hypothetical protein
MPPRPGGKLKDQLPQEAVPDADEPGSETDYPQTPEGVVWGTEAAPDDDYEPL